MTTATQQHIPSLLTGLELTDEQLNRVLVGAQKIKKHPSNYVDKLKGRSAALFFEKSSLRTRSTFELGIQQMGGAVTTHFGSIDSEREPLVDVAKCMGRIVDVIVARVLKQETLEELVRHSGVPVINALSDKYHPCQALACMQTLEESFGRLKGLKLAFIGDGNNVAVSLMQIAARLGLHFVWCGPPKHMFNGRLLTDASFEARQKGGSVNVALEPVTAVKNAHAVYTDVWASMGNEAEAEERKQTFADYQVNKDLMSLALPEAVFMHCLPAHRGEEVSAGLIDSARSLVYQEAENRLHTEKALLVELLCKTW